MNKSCLTIINLVFFLTFIGTTQAMEFRQAPVRQRDITYNTSKTNTQEIKKYKPDAWARCYMAARRIQFCAFVGLTLAGIVCFFSNGC